MAPDGEIPDDERRAHLRIADLPVAEPDLDPGQSSTDRDRADLPHDLLGDRQLRRRPHEDELALAVEPSVERRKHKRPFSEA
jgi:hypothetical protein